MLKDIKILTTLALNLRDTKYYLKRATRQYEKMLNKDTHGWYKFQQERASAQYDACAYSLKLAKRSIGRFPKPHFRALPEFGDLMTIKRWVGSCKGAAFINDDGYGNLATADQCSDIEVIPSEADMIQFPEWATHVLWYNR